MNVTTDIALCRSCSRTFSFSKNTAGLADAGPDLNNPPSGAWFEQLPSGFRIGASTRSWMALFIVPFTCVWAGGSLGGLYGSQLKKGHWDLDSSIFGIPFLIGSCALITICAMSLMGKVDVTKTQDRISIFMGLGSLGWSRNFFWNDFSHVREESRRGGFNLNGQGQLIVLEGTRRAAFGSMLNEERRFFVLSALRKMLRVKL